MKKQKSNIGAYIRQFYRGNFGYVILVVVITLLNAAINMLISWLLQQVMDLVSGTQMGFTLTQLLLITAVAVAMIGGASLLRYCSMPVFLAKAMAQYKEYVFQRLTQKSISAFAGENTALYISALSNDAATIESKYLGNIFGIIDQLILFVAALAMMLWYSPLLTAVSIALSFMPVLASLLTGGRLERAEKQVSDSNESYISTLRDSLVGFSVIKSFRAEARLCRIYGERVRAVAGAQMKREKLRVILQMFGDLSGVIVQFGVFLVGAYLAISGSDLTAGTVMVFVQLLNFVLGPISSVPRMVAECRSAKGLIRKLADAMESNVRNAGQSRKCSLEERIVLEDLSFGYEEGKPVLKNVDFTFEAGKSYAVVGGSGSGKSTLLNLLMASYDSYTGSIRYDDANLQDISSESLYDMVSVVQQNVFIFNASIRDNITMFSNFPREEVDRAIELSGLASLVAQRGEDYLCGENGSGLSGGEKQRISIARSLLKKSRVLLVDEATAALDAQTAAQVAGAILDLEDLTRIVVTHALDEALLRRYDCVLTLKNGTVTESGSFEELMEKKGYFYSLYTVSQ